jgi:hypothetical protein
MATGDFPIDIEPRATNASVSSGPMKNTVFDQIDRRINEALSKPIDQINTTVFPPKKPVVTSDPGVLPDNNPKTRFGLAKPSMAVVSPISLLHLMKAMMDGARKYGPFNWRQNSVSAGIYYSAAMRHLMAWFSGEDYAEDSGVHHLGHVMACCNIILDAQANGNLIDDRPRSEAFSELLKTMIDKAV